MHQGCKSLLIALLCVGCGVADTEQVEDSVPLQVEQEVVGGTTTCGAPGVGVLRTQRDCSNVPSCLQGGTCNPTGVCTATLIAPDMILTASHCFEFRSGNILTSPLKHYFEINSTVGPPTCSTPLRIAVKNWRSFGSCSTTYQKDVAVAQLEQPVPSSFASPWDLGTAIPANGTGAWMYGHGCTDLSQPINSSALKKTYASFTIDNNVDRLADTRWISWTNPTGVSCPGDSGGPTITTSASVPQIFWVSSGYEKTLLGDYKNRYGSVYANRTDIQTQMEQWTCPGGTEFGNRSIGKNRRYPFARVCGMDQKNYECDHSIKNWRAVGGRCGDGQCSCPNGTALGGITLPSTQWCGATVCGMDKLVYTCTSTGWKAQLGSSCG